MTEEAVILREAGVAAPILVLEGPQSEDEIALDGGNGAVANACTIANSWPGVGRHASLLAAAWLQTRYRHAPARLLRQTRSHEALSSSARGRHHRHYPHVAPRHGGAS